MNDRNDAAASPDDTGFLYTDSQELAPPSYEELRRREERLRLTLDATNDGIWDWNTRSGRVRWNARAYTMLGYAPGEFDVTFERWRSMIHPDDVDSTVASVENSMTLGEAFSVEFRLKTRDGGWLWLNGRGKPVEWDEQRRAVRVVGTHVDISERKRVEQELRRREALLSRVFDMLPVGLWFADKHGNLLRGNPAGREIWGAEPHVGPDNYGVFNARRVPSGETVEPDDWALAHTVREGVTVLGEVLEIDAFDGKQKTILNYTAPVLDETGDIDGAVVVNLDISARRAAEDRLRLHSMVLNQIADLVVVTDLEGVITYVNEAMVAALGVEREHLLGRNVAALGEDKARGATQQEIVEATLRDGHWCGQVVNFAAGGREIILECRTQLVRGDDGKAKALCGVSTDITERTRLEAQLRQQQKLEAIGTLAGGVAHEINNPINGVMNYAQLIKDLVAEREPAVDEIADEIIVETERVASIVRNLLRFARHEKEEHGPVPVHDIVDGTLALVNAVLRHDQIDLRVRVPDDLPSVLCRRQEIQQVVMNLITNARDALNARYPEYDEDKILELSAATAETGHGTCVKLTVEDHGIGIEPDVKPRIFDPFFTTKGRDQGTGLGLSISYAIVREHGGHIAVESEPGTYTRFDVFLPAAD